MTPFTRLADHPSSKSLADDKLDHPHCSAVPRLGSNMTTYLIERSQLARYSPAHCSADDNRSAPVNGGAFRGDQSRAVDDGGTENLERGGLVVECGEATRGCDLERGRVKRNITVSCGHFGAYNRISPPTCDVASNLQREVH